MLVSEGLTRKKSIYKKSLGCILSRVTLYRLFVVFLSVSPSAFALLFSCTVTHSLQYVICPFICIQYTALPLLLCCMCVCVESDAQLR